MKDAKFRAHLSEKGVDESNDPYDEDTDDEIEKVREAEKERERLQEELKSLQEQLKVKETKPVVKREDPDDPYGQDTDDDIENVKTSSSEEKAKKRRSKERNGQTSSHQNKVPQSRKLSQGYVQDVWQHFRVTKLQTSRFFASTKSGLNVLPAAQRLGYLEVITFSFFSGL